METEADIIGIEKGFYLIMCHRDDIVQMLAGHQLERKAVKALRELFVFACNMYQLG